MPPDIRILEDAEQIAGEAAQEFWGAVEEGIRSRGAPAVALSGGSTPRTLYTLPAQFIHPERGRLVWLVDRAAAGQLSTGKETH